jgi:tetratricopeptide (TPR) repeat protein
VGAVTGLEWDVATVARALGRDAADVLEALDGPRGAGLVAEAGPVGRYAFAHALVAEALLAGLAPSRRARLHLGVADALEHADRRHAGEIARHLRAAGPLVAPERSAAAELAAARQATAALAHEEAADHLEAALAALDGGQERGELLVELGDARERAGRRDLARDAFARAAEIARERGDRRLLARAALGFGGLAVVIAAANPVVVELLEEALETLPPDEHGTRARALARLAVELYYADHTRAWRLSAEAVEEARATGDASTLAAALNARRVVGWTPSQADERLSVATEMASLADTAGDREAALQGHNWRVVDLLELGRVDEAAAAVDDYERRARALALPHYGWYVPMWRACLALLSGRWEEAAALRHEALALGRRADDPNAPLLARIQHETALDLQGRCAEMDRGWIEETMGSSPVPDPYAIWLALIDARLGDLASARRRVDELARGGYADRPLDVNWHVLCDLAEAVIEMGDRRTAAAVYERLAPHARLFPLVARGIVSYGSAELYVGRLAALLGRQDEAGARLERAVEENDRIGAGPHAAMALQRLGEVLAERGEPARAREALAGSQARARALAMPSVAARAGEALRRLGRA